MNALRAFFAGLFDALFSWGQKQAEKPKTIDDAKTPKEIRDAWNERMADGLRDKQDRRD